MTYSNKKILAFVSIIFSFLITGCEENLPEISAQDHLDLAELYYNQGAFKASLVEGKNALQLKPDDVEITSTIASMLVRLNDSGSAIAITKRALEKNSNNIKLKLLLAKAYQLQGKLNLSTEILNTINSDSLVNKSEFQTLKANLFHASNQSTRAQEWFDMAIKSDAGNLDAVIGAAKISLSLKQMDKVNEYTALAAEKFPKDVRSLLWQAQVSMFQKKYREAENTLSRAMVEFENYDTLTADKYAAIDMLAKSLIAQGRIQESFTYSNYLAQSKPGRVQASYAEAMDLIRKNLDLNEAEKAFLEVLEQAPQHKPSGIMLGLIHYEKGDYIKADELLSKFSAEENSPLKSKKVLILTKLRLNKPDDAINIINSELKDHPDEADLHALLGSAQLVKNNLTLSISSFKKALSISPKHAEYLNNLAKAYILNKQTGLAVSTAQQALSAKPETSKSNDILLTLIRALVANKDYEQAKNNLDTWLKKEPENIIALNIAATLAQKNNNHKKSKTIFNKVIAIDPTNIQATISLSLYSIKEKNVEKAFELLSSALFVHPDNPQLLSLLLRLSQGKTNNEKVTSILSKTIEEHKLTIRARLALTQLHLKNKQADKALVVIKDLTEIDNKNYQAYLFKAQAYSLQNNLDEAEKTLLLLTALHENRPESYSELAKLYLRKKNPDAAINYAKKTIKLDPNILIGRIVLAKAYVQRGNHNSAREEVKAILKLAPSSHIGHEIEADILLKENEYTKAHNQLKLAWTKTKNIPLANKLLFVLQKLGQTDKATNAWTELSNEHKKNLKVQIDYSLALYQNKQYVQAQKVLEKLLKDHPKNTLILNNLASIYLETDDKRALSTAKLALNNEPDNPAIQDTVGWIYSTQYKDYDNAIPLLKDAYSKTRNSQIKEHLVETLKNAGLDHEIDKL